MSRCSSAEEYVLQGPKCVIFGILDLCCHCILSQGCSDIPSTCLCLLAECKDAVGHNFMLDFSAKDSSVAWLLEVLEEERNTHH